MKSRWFTACRAASGGSRDCRTVGERKLKRKHTDQCQCFPPPPPSGSCLGAMMGRGPSPGCSTQSTSPRCRACSLSGGVGCGEPFHTITEVCDARAGAEAGDTGSRLVGVGSATSRRRCGRRRRAGPAAGSDMGPHADNLGEEYGRAALASAVPASPRPLGGGFRQGLRQKREGSFPDGTGPLCRRERESSSVALEQLPGRRRPPRPSDAGWRLRRWRGPWCRRGRLQAIAQGELPRVLPSSSVVVPGEHLGGWALPPAASSANSVSGTPSCAVVAGDEGADVGVEQGEVWRRARISAWWRGRRAKRAGRERLAVKPIAAAVRETNWRLFMRSLLGRCPFWVLCSLPLLGARFVDRARTLLLARGSMPETLVKFGRNLTENRR